MFRTLFGVLMVLCLYFGVKAQNLILNPSFEEYHTCPDDISQIEYAKFWYNKGITPDFYHLCGYYVMESFTFDYTQPPFEGSGVAGIAISFPFRLRSDTIFREYMMGTLAQSLPDGDYFMKAHVLAYPVNRTNHLDVYFSKDKIPSFSGYAKDIVPQVSFNGWIGQFPGWKEHVACVNDLEGSRFFTVGNFQKPGTDSVEFKDVNFSNVIHLDAFGLYKIPEYKKVDTTVITGYCQPLDTMVNLVPIYHLCDGDTCSIVKCFDKAGSYTIKTYVKGCDKLIKETDMTVIDCDNSLLCSNIALLRSGQIAIKCSLKDNKTLEIKKLTIFDRWGNVIFKNNNPNMNEINLPTITSGVFVYKIDYNSCGQLYSKVGDITILN